MEIFFIEGFVCWRHERAQQENEARSRNWIWLDKFTSYVIIYFEAKVMQKKPTFENCPQSCWSKSKVCFHCGLSQSCFKPPRYVWDLTVVSWCRNFMFLWQRNLVWKKPCGNLPLQGFSHLHSEEQARCASDWWQTKPEGQGEERNSCSILPLRLLVFKLREVWVRGRERVCPTTTCSLWLPQAI